jgi:hypothetical protein
MKRNRYGINFDLGVPLQTEEEFELLYVDIYSTQKKRLIQWINEKEESPVIVAGQIGTGKTTLIEKAFQDASTPWDIKISVDTKVPLYERGAFWGVFLGKLLAFAQLKNVPLGNFNLSKDLIGIKYNKKGLSKLINELTVEASSAADFKSKKRLFDIVEKELDFIKSQIGKIIDMVEKRLDRKLFLFIEGIDKFNPRTASYISLIDLLNYCTRCKTLYEANFIHLLTEEIWIGKSRKRIILTSALAERIAEVLSKRLGVYEKSRKDILSTLSTLSGGNIRQGLRLLIEYDYAIEEVVDDSKKALDYACRRVRHDLLDTLSSPINPDLLKVVSRDKYLASGILRDIGTREDAKSAVYRNWIIIKDEQDENLRWPAAVNPLLLPALQTFKEMPESPETKTLREWAEAHEISPFGLEIDISALNKDRFFDIIAESSTMSTLNIMKIFDSLASYFLNTERMDKIIIAYDNIELAKLASDFIIGRAGTYRPGNFKDIEFDQVPHYRLDIYFKEHEKEELDGYSVFFIKKIPKNELIELDQRRDAFIDQRMIWWVPYNDLMEYLKYWNQLRQFFKIYRLENDVLGSVSIEEIEEDMEDIEAIDFVEYNKEQLKKRLQNVLNYLKSVKDEK